MSRRPVSNHSHHHHHRPVAITHPYHTIPYHLPSLSVDPEIGLQLPEIKPPPVVLELAIGPLAVARARRNTSWQGAHTTSKESLAKTPSVPATPESDFLPARQNSRRSFDLASSSRRSRRSCRFALHLHHASRRRRAGSHPPIQPQHDVLEAQDLRTMMPFEPRIKEPVQPRNPAATLRLPRPHPHPRKLLALEVRIRVPDVGALHPITLPVLIPMSHWERPALHEDMSVKCLLPLPLQVIPPLSRRICPCVLPRMRCFQTGTCNQPVTFEG